MDTTRVHPHDHKDTIDARHSCLERSEAHGCYGGLVFIGHLALDLESGEEAEVFESVPCRRCAANA